MANKMTKKDYFNELKEIEAVKANPALVAFIDHEIDLLTRKNSGEHKPTKNQKANEEIKADLFDQMEPNVQYTITEMVKTLPAVEGFTGQKVSALVRQMVKDGQVKRTEAKRVAYFTAVK